MSLVILCMMMISMVGIAFAGNEMKIGIVAEGDKPLILQKAQVRFINSEGNNTLMNQEMNRITEMHQERFKECNANDDCIVSLEESLRFENANRVEVKTQSRFLLFFNVDVEKEFEVDVEGNVIAESTNVWAKLQNWNLVA